MADARPLTVTGNGNVVGNESQSVVQKSEGHAPTAMASVVITGVPDKLPAPGVPELASPTRDWITYVLTGIFAAFCLATIISPLTLFEYSTRAPAVEDITHLLASLSSAMSGVTGLIGVLVGYRIRDRRQGA